MVIAFMGLKFNSWGITTVRQLKLIIAALFLISPFAANADLVRVHYDGTVTTALGDIDVLGFSDGDDISGWFEFDTDDFVTASGDRTVLYGNVTSNLSGFIDVYSTNGDIVDIDESWGGDPSRTRFFPRDYTYETNSGYHYLRYYWLSLLDDTSWISPADFTSGFSIDTTGFLGASGSVFTGARNLETDEYDREFGVLSFNVNRIYTAVTVPEPGTLALLGIGLLGMGAARRKKKA